MMKKRVALIVVLISLVFTTLAQVTFKEPGFASLPSTPEKMVQGDFNNDGKADFAVCNFNSLSNRQVTILLNTGAGAFSGFEIRNFGSSINALNIAAADFNKDGNLDVVTISQTNDNFSLLLGDGNGNLAAPVNFTVGDTPQGLEVADFNKDGNADIIVSSRGTPDDVRVFLGNGTGGFGTPLIIDIPNAFDVAVADFNKDSNPDFAVVVGTTVQIWFGDGSGSVFSIGPTITGFGISGQDVLAADVDADGDTDIIAASGYSLNDGNGNFGTRVTISSTGYNYAVGDLNKDGIPDIISNDTSSNGPHVRVFIGTGSGTFILLAKFQVSIIMSGMIIQDVNNDGNPDVIGAGPNGSIHRAEILFGDGTGFFTNTKIKYITPTDPQDLVKGDFNEDGLIDAAISHTSGNFVTVYLGAGGEKFVKTATNHATGTFPFQIAAIDYNNDSHLDLATYNQTAGSITVLTGNGTGSFSLLGNFAASATAGRMTYGDFNNDNFIDFVVTNGAGQSFSLLTGTGSGFNAPIIISLTERAYEIKAIDFNKDGNLDLVADYDSGFGTFTGNGDGTFSIGTSRLPVSGSFFLVADINYDTHLDVVGFANTTFGNDFFINDGTGVFTGSSISVTLGGFPYAFEDMNNDGFKDLIVGSQNNITSEPGQIVIFRGSSTGITNTVLVDQDGSGGRRLFTHDMNNDGKLDIVALSFNIYEDYLTTLINTTTPVGCPNISLQPDSETTCEGQPVIFSVAATGNAPLSYQWRKGTVNISGATSAIYSINSVTAADAGIYNCVVSNSCGSVISNNATLVVNPAPSNPITVSASRCGPGTVTLSASGGTPGNYVWFNNLTDFIPIPGAVNDAYTTPVLSATTSFYVAIVSGSCVSGLVQAIATINSAPTAPTVTNASNCGPGTITLVANGGTNGQYRWYDIPSGGTALAGEVNDSFTTPVLTATTPYYVSINNGNCESDRTTVTASVFSVPGKPTITASETINAGIVAICLQPVILTAPAGFTSYSWSNSQITQQISTLLSGNYSVVVTDANGCSSVASDVLQLINNAACVNNPPLINTTSAKTFIGGKVTIDLSTLISDPDNNLDPTSLQVLNNATQKGGKTTLNGFILEIDYTDAKFSGKDLVNIRVCDLLNVCFEAAFEIDVVGDIIVYNGISPNGDTRNDTWIIEYVTLFPDTQNNRVTIYNRWGDLVWEGENYDNDNVVFTGLNKNGNDLATGTYFYKIEFNSGRETITGYLSLKK